MSQQVIITYAVTGSIHTPTMSPHLPITTAKIADAAIGATQASLRGGNVWVDLEDSPYIGKRQLATLNAQQIAKVRGIIESLGMTAATPNEARDRLFLKGADRVEF